MGTTSDLDKKLEELTQQVKNIASSVKEASNEAKMAVQNLNRFLSRVKPAIWGPVLPLLAAMIGYAFILRFLIVPNLVTQQLNVFSLWHNIALILSSTVVLGFIVWAIVKIYQPE